MFFLLINDQRPVCSNMWMIYEINGGKHGYYKCKYVKTLKTKREAVQKITQISKYHSYKYYIEHDGKKHDISLLHHFIYG